MRIHLLSATVGLPIMFIVTSRCAAQVPAGQAEPERSRGISVLGTGEVRAKPNLVEIDLKASGTAELSGDAIIKYRDTKRRMVQALESLKFTNLQITELAISLSNGVDANQMQQALMRGQPMQDKSPLQVSRLMRVSLGEIQKLPEEELMEMLGKIFDVARDSGIAMAPSPEAAEMARRYGRDMPGAGLSFVLDKLSELREQAYQKAVDDARARAQRLAHLTGLTLGPVAWVQELQVSGDEVQPAYPQPYYVNPTATLADTSGPRVTASNFGEIPIRVKLLVRFDVAKPESETARR